MSFEHTGPTQRQSQRNVWPPRCSCPPSPRWRSVREEALRGRTRLPSLTRPTQGETDGCERGGGEVSGSARVDLVESCSLDEIRCRDDEGGPRSLL